MDLKQKIIDAATKSFTLFGYKATSVDQIAKVANVGKGTIYTFFSSKEELFSHILNGMISEMKLVAEQAIQPDRTFFDNLQLAFSEILAFRKQHELFVKMIQEVREFGTSAVKEGMQKVEDAIIQFIAKEISTGIEHGEVKPCDPELVAYILLKTYTSLVFDWEQKRPALSDQQIADVFRLIFAEGLNCSADRNL